MNLFDYADTYPAKAEKRVPRPGQRLIGGRLPKDALGPSPRKLKRLLAMFDRRGPDDCWPWTGSINSITARGQFFWDGRTIPSSRAAYLLLVGPVSRDLCVCHHCDNPACCNPKHLFLGTHQDNMRDMISKGRQVLPDTVGEANSAAKLTEAEVLAIRASKKAGVVLAREYRVSPTNISDIRTGKIWRHLLPKSEAA